MLIWLRFEMKKFWGARRNWLLLLFLVVTLIGVGGFIKYKDLHYQKWYKDQITFEQVQSGLKLQSFGGTIKYYESIYETTKSPEDLKTIEHLKVLQGDYREWYTLSAKLQREKGPLEKLALDIEREQLLLKFYALNEINIEAYTYAWIDFSTFEADLMIKRHLLDNGIEPPSSPYELTGRNFLSKQFSYIGLLLWSMLAVVLASDCFLDDIKSGTYKIIYSLDGKRFLVVFSKWISVILNFLIIFLSLNLVAIVYFMVMRDFGDSHYPVLFQQNHVETWLNSMLHIGPMAFSLIVFIVTLTMGLSIGIMDFSETIILALFILVFDYFIVQSALKGPTLSSYFAFYPLFGLNVQRYYSYHASEINWIIPHLISWVSSVCVGFLAGFQFTKKDL